MIEDMPTKKQWAEFRETLDELDVWNWLGEYSNEEAADGTQWDPDVEYAVRHVVSFGSNSYPGQQVKSKGMPEPTKALLRHCAAVEKLLGGRPFK